MQEKKGGKTMRKINKVKLLMIFSFVYAAPLTLCTIHENMEIMHAHENKEKEGNNEQTSSIVMAPKVTVKEEEKESILDRYISKVSSFYQLKPEFTEELVAEHVEEILSYDDIEKGMILTVGKYAPQNEMEENQFAAGTRYDQEMMDSFKDSYAGQVMVETTQRFGIDPALLMALCKQESNLDHEHHLPTDPEYGGTAYGITQQEYTKWEHGESELTGNTYTENGIGKESVWVSEDTAMDIDGNIKMGTIYLQQSLKQYHYNLFLALQGYNYGTAMMDIVIQLYANELGISKEQVMENYNDFGWMKYVEMIHHDPSDYIDGEWEGTYGDSEYISHVLSYVGKDTIYIETEDGLLLYRLKNMQTMMLQNDSLTVASHQSEQQQLEQELRQLYVEKVAFKSIKNIKDSYEKVFTKEML